jgi:2-oxo-4-hydroxy-4-carboxy-5-ureidoimidazoline decarboxylase
MTLDSLNRADPDAFVAALGGIFEHSPWVAEQVVAHRPFASIEALHAAMCAAVAAAGHERQMALIRAHPQLAGKAAIRGELTESSTNEQRGAGLDQCSPEQFAEITRLNADYDARFGFPFILAVKGHTRDSIIANMRARIGHDRDAEIAEALKQIERIAGFRLEALVL